MKLYFSKNACSLCIRIAINELQLPCEFESVDLENKKTEKGIDYLTINPKGAVPALRLDNNEVLTENSIILQYLADTHHAIQLLPALGDFKRYRVLECMNFITTDIHKGFGPLFNPAVSQEAKNEIFMPYLKTKFKYLENIMKHHKYITGDRFTLPDAYLFVMLTWLKKFKVDIKNVYPHLAIYFDELQKRKSIVQSLEEEGIVL